MALPSASSWGHKGYNEVWVEGANDWLYRHLHACGRRMKELGERFSSYLDKPKDNPVKRALNQAARELLLAQSSDWAFIMKTGTMVPYAQKRSKVHIGRFNRLYEQIVKSEIDKEWLTFLEAYDNIFHDIECASFYVS